MKLYLKFLGVFLLSTHFLFGQGENNIWPLNYEYILNFNTTPPSLNEINSFIYSQGPSSAICDKSGNLLFLTDGRQVLDRDIIAMPNGEDLKGSPFRATMPVLCLPFPETTSKYLIFSMKDGYSDVNIVNNNTSVDYYQGALYYSEIDMELNNGKGDVVEAKKNVLLTDQLTGQLVAANGICGNLWILTHEWQSNRFFAYKVTAKGVMPPVISSIGNVIDEPEFVYHGRIEDGKISFSPSYNKFLLMGGAGKFIQLFDFDRASGIITNPISLPIEEKSIGIFAGCFSPDGSKVYYAEYSKPDSINYYQVNIESSDLERINQSKKKIGSMDYHSDHNMVLGPDGIIYLTRPDLGISFISDPNDEGLEPTIIDTLDILLNNGIGSFTGLYNPTAIPDAPSIKDSLLLPLDQQLCQNTQLNLQIQAEGDTYRWQDGSSTKDYEITAPGTYWVEVQKGNCTFTDTLEILPDESLVELGKDTTICQDEALMIEVAAQAGSTYQWQDGSTNPSLTISTAGLYWVESTDSLCSYRDSILVEIEEIVVALPEDTVLCPNQNLFLNVAQTGVDYEWQDGSTQATFSVSAAGLYWVEAQNGTCSIRDSLIVSIREEALFLPNDTILCNVSDYLIIPDTSFKNIIWWQSPLSGDSLLVTTSGTYHALPADNNCFYDSITVTFQEVTLALPTDTILCMEDDLLLDVGTLNGQLIWQDGSTDQQFLITESGTYWANLTKNNCTVSDSIEVSIAPLTVALGQDTTLCENESLALTINTPNGNYEWQDGSLAQNYTITQTGIYWAKITKDNCVASDSIRVNFTPQPTIDLGVDMTLCMDETLTLIAPTILTNYQWQDGTINNPQLVTESGNYWLEGAIDNCIARDSIFVTFEACPEDTKFCQAYLPNSFSPNGDGINDVLQLLTDCELQFFEMEVYDRWGSLVFSTTDVRQAWDGTANGELLDTGVYLWTVRYQFVEQDLPVEKVETVTIIR